MIEIYNYVNGRLEKSISEKVMNLYNPANGQVMGHIPDSNKDDVETAYKAAENAFTAWSTLSNQKRSYYLQLIADKIRENLLDLAIAESMDNGKPIKLATRVDIPRAATNFEFFAHAITQFASESHDMGEKGINYTLRQPLGVVGCISPWNLPLYLFSWKIAPALAAGNTVVAKPSEVTPYTAFLLSKICIEIGLPAGVLNIIHGYGHEVGDAITRHLGIKAISFTGSTRVGGMIASIAAPMFKKVSLEMGGKNANIIFADADYDKMLKTTLNSSFANQGQICLCGSRIFVERSIYARFKKDFIEGAKKMTVGHPSESTSKLGAVVSKEHYNKILNCIDEAKKEGGQILTGGNAVFPKGYEKGYYIEPTVIEGLDSHCKTNQEEIFGPVVTIAPFDTKEEALEMANDTKYGLSCTLWTENLTRAHQMARKLHVGIVWVNTWLMRDLRTPFGGVKHSGVGREGGKEALYFFTEPKNVCIAL